ncbi:hypothetical protein EU527_17355 [Candidatus Thorarchaeota archaeon]|nr:MAG: hypothetical protein EU527_17355 [Candidatus Thorarchaeota archaeon]
MKIEATSCNRCNRTIIPPRRICPYCGQTAGIMEQVVLDNNGTIISYTTLNISPEGSSQIRLALVKLEKDAVVLCLADENKIEEIEIGLQVELTLDNETRFRYRVIR